MLSSMDIWQKFICLPGSSVDGVVGIATENAIKGLIQLIKKYRPLKVLELGAGIGTLTYTSLVTLNSVYPDKKYFLYTVENNSFCLEQLGKNLMDVNAHYEVIQSIELVKERSLSFDLIIVDGGGDQPNDLGVIDFSNLLNRKGVIFIEGYRKFQRSLIEEWYRERSYVYAKMSPTVHNLFSISTGEETKNKPYHYYIFEPSARDRVRVGLAGMFSSSVSRIRSKVGV